jgi:hypothetical protein
MTSIILIELFKSNSIYYIWNKNVATVSTEKPSVEQSPLCNKGYHFFPKWDFTLHLTPSDAAIKTLLPQKLLLRSMFFKYSFSICFRKKQSLFFSFLFLKYIRYCLINMISVQYTWYISTGSRLHVFPGFAGWWSVYSRYFITWICLWRSCNCIIWYDFL